ncbi:Gcd10p family-domain-containing protein [Xylariaceae sp. FL1272]|nr:Gcd10p family-domain-containing protein [Xylariaceae sp. FL1272]
MHALVQPNGWVALKLPSGNLRVLQVTPNTTISLGKYGAFPSNLIIRRPYHFTYELVDKRAGESFNRLRIVPAAELYADTLTSDTPPTSSEAVTPAPDTEDATNSIPAGVEYSLVDADSGAVVAKTDRAELDASARQALTIDEIEELKKDGTDAGRDLIAKLMLSHTAIDEKTEYSLAKYKLLKTKKYIRRFSVLPFDIPLLNFYALQEKDPTKIMDIREEMIALLGCWANVHFGGEDPETASPDDGDTKMEDSEMPQTSTPGRWLVVDDTSGLLVGAMAERMGILYPPEPEPQGQQELIPESPVAIQKSSAAAQLQPAGAGESTESVLEQTKEMEEPNPELNAEATQPTSPTMVRKRPRTDDFHIPFSHSNTITLITNNSQPNLSYLRYHDFDISNQLQSHTLTHPLSKHLMTLTWLQLLEPSADPTYNSPTPTATPEEMAKWKANRKSNFHRKRRRWARTRHIIDATRKGEFSGLVVASTMDAISIMRSCVPLLAGGAPIAIYSPTVEGLTELVDCYSIARRAAWATSMPAELEGKSVEEQENWKGNDDFPLNPSLVLGAAIQTSRVRQWQVLPGRTHPLMTSRGGPEGYVFTAWRVKPAEGKVEARGKAARKKRKIDEGRGEAKVKVEDG